MTPMAETDWINLIDGLEKIGFYAHTSAERIPDVKAEAIRTHYLFGWEETERDWHADAEDLTEGDVADFVRRLSRFLEREGVRLTSIEQEFVVGGAYSVSVNGAPHVMYSAEECVESEDLWLLTTKRAFGLVNALLVNAGSTERVLALYGGNDLRAIFLTDRMYEAILASGLLAPSEVPVRPEDL